MIPHTPMRMRTDLLPPDDANHASLTKGNEAAAFAAEERERLLEELELVSYCASHDLQAPLRAILVSCGELGDDPKLPADQRDALQRIVSREAHRLQALLQGLLEYLRLETFVPAFTSVDTDAAFSDARSALGGKIEKTGARIVVQHLPAVWGHKGRITRLLTQLLDNALTFRQDSPEIYVTAYSQGREVEFCVRDNGIGIDEEYHEIIFRLFQCLGEKGSSAGEGIGLALCSKIVQSHGGRLWVESAPGQGARFHFTLPAASGRQ